MEYLNLGLVCDHCGHPIESKPCLKPRTMVLSGFEAMVHRHIHNKREDCTVTIEGSASPHSECGNRDLYYKKLSDGGD